MEIPLGLRNIFYQIKAQYEKALENQQELEYIASLEQFVADLNSKYQLSSQKSPKQPKKLGHQLDIFQILEQSQYTSDIDLDYHKKTQSSPTFSDNLSINSATDEIKTNLELTSSQKKAFLAIKTFIRDSNQKYFRLTGYAGTGKSYLIIELMNWLASKRLNFIAASPTNKASKNLAKLARENKFNVETTTIAKLLGQQPEINQESGQEDFISNQDVSLEHYDLVILDEFSMISQSNFKEIIEATSYSNTKLIFVGDAAQLPPVGEKQPIIASTDLIKDAATLTQVVRYEGEIGQIAEAIRNNSRYQHQVYPFATTTDKSIICLNRQQWLNQAAKYFQSENFRQNPDYCRILVWRNKTADSLNHWLRLQLWGKNPPAFVKGDRLIAKKPVFRLAPSLRGKKKNEWRIVMNNSEECEVTGEAKLAQAVDFEFWQVPVITDDGVALVLRILTPESEKKRQQKLKKFREAKDWFQLLNLDKSYDYCPFAYTLTTHKAQGSSIDYVFLDLQDIRLCRDLQKILYTALTRAKVRAYISN